VSQFFFYIAIAYEMKQPTLMAKLSVMRSEFQQTVSWIDQIPLKKWTQAYDGGKRFGHMTTNLAKCINLVLKVHSLFLYVLLSRLNLNNKRLVCWTRDKGGVHVTSRSPISERHYRTATQKWTTISYVHCAAMTDIT